MAKIWLALLLVATLGSVDPVASEITVVNVKDAWKTFKPDTVPDEITNCDGLTCNSALVDPNASDLNTLCTAIYTYSSCAKEKCSSTLTDAKKQELQGTEDLCKTADLEAAMTDVKGNCDKCDTQAGAVDSATGLDAKCLASLSFIKCVATQTDCSTVPPAHVEALKEVVFGNAMTSIKGECDDIKCPSTAVDSASGINDKCLASLTYIECVVKAKKDTTCASVDDADVDALKTLCKGIPLFDFGIALVDVKDNCDCESTDIDSASALDGKCLASQTYLTCVKTSCTSVPDDDVEALRTPCKEILFGNAMTTIKGNCDNIKCDSTDVDSASGINAKCLESESYIACVTTKCNTTVPATDVEALKTPCKVSILSGGDGGDDDSCSILQVSILALMLSLLISII